MNKYDVGKLKRGMRVIVGGKIGTVVRPHEPEWTEHKTKAFKKELQGADIRFDHDGAWHVYIHAENIDVLEPKP